MQSQSEASGGAPIFLICSERSGSNLISVIMGAHPDVYAHPPYHLGRDLILNLHTALGHGTAAWQFLVDHAAAKVASYRSDEEAARLRDRLAGQVPPDPRALARFIWQQMPAEAAGKRVFIKENNIHKMLFFLLDCFPDARFVFQVRDPRDFLASAKARRKGWLGTKFGSMRNALAVWRDDQLGGLAALALLGPGRVHLMRYEDLVARSEPTLRKLCGFLGLTFDPAMMNYHNSEQSVKLAATTSARANVGQPLMTRNFAKYRAGLTRGQICAVEAHLGELMDLFGYPRDYPEGTGFFSRFGPQLTEPLERLVNREFGPWYKSGQKRLARNLAASAAPLLPPLVFDDGPADDAA
jgi:hypothetical protein